MICAQLEQIAKQRHAGDLRQVLDLWGVGGVEEAVDEIEDGQPGEEKDRRSHVDCSCLSSEAMLFLYCHGLESSAEHMKWSRRDGWTYQKEHAARNVIAPTERDG